MPEHEEMGDPPGGAPGSCDDYGLQAGRADGCRRIPRGERRGDAQPLVIVR
jgi:hypothetical protein